MNSNAGEQKTALRTQLRKHKPSVTERADLSGRLCALLEQQAIWRNARLILFFVPRPDEPDIWPLVHSARVAGKTAAFPRFLGGTEYVAGVVNDPALDLQPGQFGILEPLPEAAIVPFERLNLTLVPGLAFTLDGCRLGRGKGYYDRLLAKISGTSCGVAFDWQITTDLPMESHDVRLHSILTPTRWWPASPPSY